MCLLRHGFVYIALYVYPLSMKLAIKGNTLTIYTPMLAENVLALNLLTPRC